MPPRSRNGIDEMCARSPSSTSSPSPTRPSGREGENSERVASPRGERANGSIRFGGLIGRRRLNRDRNGVFTQQSVRRYQSRFPAYHRPRRPPTLLSGRFKNRAHARPSTSRIGENDMYRAGRIELRGLPVKFARNSSGSRIRRHPRAHVKRGATRRRRRDGRKDRR